MTDWAKAVVVIGRLPAPLVYRLGNIRQAALAQGAVGRRDGGGCGVGRARRAECRLEIGGRRNGDDAVVRREAFGKQMEVDLGSGCAASVPSPGLRSFPPSLPPSLPPSRHPVTLILPSPHTQGRSRSVSNSSPNRPNRTGTIARPLAFTHL